MSRAAFDYSEIPEGDCAPDCLHPRHVYELIGHSAQEQKLASRVNSGNLHHAWLITGGVGTGKATLAYRFIRRVLGGQAQTPGRLDVPQTDPVAQRIASLGHGDFLLLRRPYDPKTKKIKTEIVVSETRRLSEFFAHKPSEGGWRVCLIDAADDMNISAANAVLKTLEEPPSRALIILLSSEPGKLLPTIRSRCMQLALRPVPQADITDWLLKRGISPDIAQIAAGLSRGAPGKAFALAKSEAKVLRPMSQLLASFPAGNGSLEHKIAESLTGEGARSERELFWDVLIDLIQAQARYAAIGEWDSAFAPLKLARSPIFWTSLQDELTQMRRAEDGLNMDPVSVMLSALGQIRAPEAMHPRGSAP